MNSTPMVPESNVSLSTLEENGPLSSEAIESMQSESNAILVTSYHIIRHFITPAVCLLSMGALIFTLIFLHRKKLVRVTALIYLKFMGFVDLLSLVVLFISFMDYFLPSSHAGVYYTSALVRALYACLLGLLLTSNWLMTAQAVERTFAISRPFKAKRIREKHRRIVVSVICLASILLTIPTLVLDIMELTRYKVCFGNGEMCENDMNYSSTLGRSNNISKEAQKELYFKVLEASKNQSQTSTVNNAFGTAAFIDTWPEPLKRFHIVQAWIIHFFIFFVLPFVFLCLASFCLLSAVRTSGRFVRQHCIRGGVEYRNTQREEARMTVLILCLIGAFFICQSPFVIYSACHKVGIFSKPSPGHSLIRATITLALALKSDCTFVFHCWLNQRFALALRRMLCSFSASNVSTRCHGSKSYSQGDSSSQGNWRQQQTRSFIKHHAMQQNNRADEKHIKTLLKEIDHKRKNSSSKDRNDEAVHRTSKLNFSKPVELVRLELKRQCKKPCEIPVEDAMQPDVAKALLVQPNASESAVQVENAKNRTEVVGTEAPNGSQPTANVPRRCRGALIMFFSENDICASCATVTCSCGTSCQGSPFESSFNCTAETSTQCRYSISKSFSLPPLNSAFEQVDLLL